MNKTIAAGFLLFLQKYNIYINYEIKYYYFSLKCSRLKMNSLQNEGFTVFSWNKRGDSSVECPEPDETAENDIEIEESTNILCIIHNNGKIGCAYFNLHERLLYVYEEFIELGPHFLFTMNLLQEIRPKYILSFGNTADDFIQFLIEAVTIGSDATATSDSLNSLPQNFFLLSLKEYTYEICKAILSKINLTPNVDEPSDVEREVYIHSLINFEHRSSVQAIGALINYLEKNWGFFGITKEDLQYLCINQVTRKHHVLVDTATFDAINIFSERSHDAGFKHGHRTSSREALSIYRLFSSNCKSKIGLATLRNILLNPIKDIDELKTRLDFMDFVLQPSNKDFFNSLQLNMRQLGNNINVIIKRIQNFRASNRDWNVLHKAIHQTIFINDLCFPYMKKSKILRDLHNAISPHLLGLEHSVDKAIDLNCDRKQGRPVIRFGLDEHLDAKRLRQQGMAKDLTAAARFSADNLPDFLNECAMVYLPEIGHLIAIKEWESHCDPEQLKDLDFQFMFTLRGTIHYKNPLCIELDKRLGDINAEIIDHENRILRRLSDLVVKYNKDIREPLRIIGLMDCFISMALTASQNDYIRPSLNTDNIFEIKDGKHPLNEHLVSQFQTNDFYSGGQYSHMKIITGPNGSGKSMYLKQLALIVYLAHVGSYVPVKSANIALVHSIHSRIQATESVSVRLSAFMIDVTQVSQALNNATLSSLILMDEFGKGTTEKDGLSILVGTLRNFLKRKEDCPHVIVSTHFQQIIKYIPRSPLLEYQKMNYKKDQGSFYFLYKLTPGVSASFAFEVAETIGVDKNILLRAREILRGLRNNEIIQPLKENIRSHNSKNLTKLNVPKPDED